MKEYISGRQTTFLALGIILGTTFLPLGQVLSGTAGRDGWLTIFPAFFAAFPLVYLTLYTFLHAPGKNIFEQIKSTLSPWLGYPFLVLYLITSSSFTALLLRQGGELFSNSLMVETPLWVFITGITIFLVFTVSQGVEVFARFNEITVVAILASLFLLILFGIPKAEISYLRPMLYNGFEPLAQGFLALPWGFEYIFVLYMLLPFVHKPHEVIRASLRGYFLVSLLLTGVVVIEIAVFSPEETARLFYGALSLARIAELGQIFHGLEPFFIVFWFGANLIKTAAFFFCSYYCFQAIIPIKPGISPISIMGLVLALLAFYPKNSLHMVMLIDLIDNLIVLLSSLGTVLLALVTFVKYRRQA